jgi:hypothetical protein
VSIHKWPFFRRAAFSAAFRLRRTLSTPRRKPLCGLARRKICSFMNWTRNDTSTICGWALFSIEPFQKINEIMISFGKTTDFIDRVIHRLYEKNRYDRIFSKDITNSSTTSAVLFLLGMHCKEKDVSNSPCLILNKRSLKVKQPGDLCCPGGSISSRVDAFLSKMLYLPGSPLTRWPYWQLWHKQRRHEAKKMALLFATCLREGFEEMHLNPLRVKLLGPLPSQQLIMFHRVIYPMVCWVNRQQQFILNWEVERVVYIPLKNLLDPSYYARYRLQVEKSPGDEKNPDMIDYPCFIQKDKDHTDILWGATFRITMVFLENVFGYKPPNMESLPVVFGSLDKNYLPGNG